MSSDVTSSILWLVDSWSSGGDGDTGVRPVEVSKSMHLHRVCVFVKECGYGVCGEKVDNGSQRLAA